MRIAVVGPTHPIKGGVSQHTTALAARLRDAGHDVRIVSWRRQYPALLYPGEQEVSGPPELAAFQPTERALSWNRPDSWVRTARRLAGHDLVVLAHVTPVQVAPYRTMLTVLRRTGTRTAVICHNVLPHERSRLDTALVGLLLRAADLVLVHSKSEAAVARELTERPVVEAPLAPFLPHAFAPRHPLAGEHRRLLFFGLVRPYKGLDVLLRALALAPADIRLRVAGEFWGGTETTKILIDELDLGDRVELRPGYARADEVPALFEDVDALVLPYRSATGSQGVSVAFEFGVPVIVTRAGHLADGVRDGVDGLVAEPGDAESLADALTRFYAPGVPDRMRQHVRPLDATPFWNKYVEALLSQPQRGGPPGARRSASVAKTSERGEQRDYSTLQPLMLNEQHRRTKARKIVRVLEHVLGPGGLSGRVAVDIGCSAGFISDELAARGAVTTGVDIDEPGLDVARERFGDHVRFLCASGDAMPFAAESVDVVVLNHIYEHVPNADAVLTEIHRVLRPDGIAYLGLGNKHQLVEPHYRLPLLSWLPKRLADRYMRLARRGDHYYETYATRRGLKHLLRGFRVLDFTLPVIHRPEVYGSEDQVSTRVRVPLVVARAVRPLVPTFVWVATKGDLVPAVRDGMEGLEVLDLRGTSR